MDPSWLVIARRDIGVQEIPGPASHPRIAEYHRSTNLSRKLAGLDELPWCSSAINTWLEEAGYQGTDSAAAKSWLTWGLELPEPWLGCITVIKRREDGPDGLTGSGSGWHVALWTGHFRLLGGNQSDRVRYTVFQPTRYDYRGYRWPVHRQA